MQMRDYMNERNLTLADIGEMVRKSAMTVSRHVRGESEPDVSDIETYRKVTGGSVIYEDWVATRKAYLKGVENGSLTIQRRKPRTPQPEKEDAHV